jgi:cytochrome P450
MMNERVGAATKGLELNNDLFSTFCEWLRRRTGSYVHHDSVESETSDKSKQLNKDEIVAQTAVLLLAGQDTTVGQNVTN